MRMFHSVLMLGFGGDTPSIYQVRYDVACLFIATTSIAAIYVFFCKLLSTTEKWYCITLLEYLIYT